MLNYSEIIQKAVNEDKEFQKALKIVQKNSTGKIWAVGSFVFRNLASAIYDLPKPIFKDYDFIVEKRNAKLELEKNVNFTINTFGNIKIINEPITIDVWESKIEDHLNDTSLNIQSISYDIRDNKLFGNIGIKAILDKKISVNNPETLKFYTNKKGITIEDYINQKIKKWGFEDFFFDLNSL